MRRCVKAAQATHNSSRQALVPRQRATRQAEQASMNNPHLDDEEARPAVAANEAKAPEAAAVPPHNDNTAADAFDVDRAVGHWLIARDVLARHLDVHQALLLQA